MTDEFSPVLDITDPLEDHKYVQKIVHLRNYLEKGKEYSDYFTKTNKGGITIVSRLFKDENNNPVTLAYGVSFASPKEQFNRKFGVQLALDRLIHKDTIYSSRMRFVNTRYDNDIILMSIISDILRNMKYPKHAKEILTSKFISV